MSTGEAELDTALATDKSAPLDLLNPDSALGTLPEVHPNHLLLLFALNARTFMENVGASFAMNTPTSVAFTQLQLEESDAVCSFATGEVGVLLKEDECLELFQFMLDVRAEEVVNWQGLVEWGPTTFLKTFCCREVAGLGGYVCGCAVSAEAMWAGGHGEEFFLILFTDRTEEFRFLQALVHGW